VQHQPPEVQTIYAELVERLTAMEASRAIGQVPGTFVTKVVKGETYYYFQHAEPGGTKRQIYVGRKDPVLDTVVARHQTGRAEAGRDADDVRRLCALLRAGGALVADNPSARVLRALADSAVFHMGGVLVGTHAFTVIGNLLGARWDQGGLRTQDIDIAAVPNVSVAVQGLSADVPGVLASLEMGFLPVPGLDPTRTSTSFKVRGQGLRVDLLTPARRGVTSPVPMPRLRAAAEPLRYLDYVIEGAVRGAVVDGGGILVNVPDPARFALHKAIVAGLRPAVMHTKRDKDLSQATQVLEVLAEERPGDIVLAWEALTSRGPSWSRLGREALTVIAGVDPVVGANVGKLIP
jgi:hypothetical protein